MLAAFFSSPLVWSTSLVELVTIASIVGIAAGAYRRIECHKSTCHRIGRFTHGHLRLCHVHSPIVKGQKITQAHIDRAAD